MVALANFVGLAGGLILDHTSKLGWLTLCAITLKEEINLLLLFSLNINTLVIKILTYIVPFCTYAHFLLLFFILDFIFVLYICFMPVLYSFYSAIKTSLTLTHN